MNILTSVNAALKVSPKYPGNNTYLIAEYWKRLEIECVLQDEPSNAVIRWVKDGKSLDPSDRIVIKDNAVNISHAQEFDAGQYRCDVYEGSNKSPSGYAELLVKFKPYTWFHDKDLTVIEEMPINLTCLVKGNKVEVKWRYENDTGVAVERNFTYFDADGVKNGRLFVKSANKTDRGSYYCSGRSGDLQSEESKVFVRIKGKYAALWPFLGICLEVLVLCTVIFIYEKRRDKTELEESDTDQGPEPRSSPDHGADGLRHRN